MDSADAGYGTLRKAEDGVLRKAGGSLRPLPFSLIPGFPRRALAIRDSVHAREHLVLRFAVHACGMRGECTSLPS